jgi:phosphatidylinositol kinase/protein kinase (PI-3  family)
MQLFGLVNTLLSEDEKTAQRNLHIHRFAVIPLSPNSGLIEWVPYCDTIHSLIRSYRDTRKIMLNVEQRLSRWFDCFCDVHLCSLHSAHANLTIDQCATHALQ